MLGSILGQREYICYWHGVGVLTYNGEASPPEQIGGVAIRFVPYLKDPKIVARYYQAADLYLHPARADTFPTTVLEALARGTPVVASAVGGIPEQDIEGRTGFLVPVGDAQALARRVLDLLGDEVAGRGGCARRFGRERVVGGVSCVLSGDPQRRRHIS